MWISDSTIIHSLVTSVFSLMSVRVVAATRMLMTQWPSVPWEFCLFYQAWCICKWIRVQYAKTQARKSEDCPRASFQSETLLHTQAAAHASFDKEWLYAQVIKVLCCKDAHTAAFEMLCALGATWASSSSSVSVSEECEANDFWAASCGEEGPFTDFCRCSCRPMTQSD